MNSWEVQSINENEQTKQNKKGPEKEDKLNPGKWENEDSTSVIWTFWVE